MTNSLAPDHIPKHCTETTTKNCHKRKSKRHITVTHLLDPVSDVYPIGVICYILLTGKIPWN